MAKPFGNDHATAMHGAKVVRDRHESNEECRRNIRTIEVHLCSLGIIEEIKHIGFILKDASTHIRQIPT